MGRQSWMAFCIGDRVSPTAAARTTTRCTRSVCSKRRAGRPTFATFLLLSLVWERPRHSLRPQNVYSNSRMVRILGTVFAALLGLAFGSFLNVCLSRWPEGESIVTPRSHCRKCGRVLAWWENVPLVSWVTLRGRCRGCGAWIGWRYVTVEAAVGGLWALAAWNTAGDSLEHLVFSAHPAV